MPDPIEELSNFEPGVPVNPLPAADVRRRGDRLRRRNAALVIGGAVAAVVLVAVPIAVFAGDDGGKAQPAPPQLTDQVLLTADEVPARERLTDWREAPEQEGEVLACAPQQNSLNDDADAWVRRDFEADVAGVPTDDLPVSVVRTSVLEFDDATSARTAYDTALGWVFDCPGMENVNRDAAEWAVVIAGGGQGEWRNRIFIAPEYCGGGDCDAAVFDRMGVAQFGDRLVLVSLAEVDGPLEPEGLDRSMEDLFNAAIAKAGGEITGGSSTGEATPAPEPSDATTQPDPVVPETTIPDNFPLAAGWPERTEPGQSGLTGPNRKLAPLELQACDIALEETAYVDRLRAEWSNIEDYRGRQLTTYDTPGDAAEALTDVIDIYQACPRTEPDESGLSSVYEVRQTAQGDESWAIIQNEEMDGFPTTSLVLRHIIRVGSAVLILSDAGEGGAAPQGALQGYIDRQLADASVPIAEMCIFTDTGC